MTQTVCWSPKPRSAYDCRIGKIGVGPGSSSLLADPLCWNLAFLSHDYEKSPEHWDAHFTSNVQRTARTYLDKPGWDQLGMGDRGRTVGTLLTLPAPRFVHLIKMHDVLRSLRMYEAYGDKWLATIEERSHLCVMPGPDNAVDIKNVGDAIRALRKFTVVR